MFCFVHDSYAEKALRIAPKDRLEYPERTMKTWSVYVLQCRDGSLYTGITIDPIRRLKQHNQGRASKYTRSRRPVILLTVYQGFTHSEALKEEAAIKALSRTQKLELVSTDV